MKRIFTLLLSLVLLISCMALSALAVTDAERLNLTLTVGGENVISVQPGDEIEVSLIMSNVAEEAFDVSNHQTQIKFDMDFFEYTDSSSSYELVKANSCNLETKSLGTKVVEIQGLHISGARPATFEASQLVAKIKFKVKEGLSIGDSGVLSFFYSGVENGFTKPITAYEINQSSLTVFIGEPPAEMHTVVYKDGDATISTNSYAANSDITINYGPSGVTDKKFVGWEDESGKIWNAGDSYTVTGDAVLTAKWVNKYTLHFETNGGTPVVDKVEWEDIDIVIANYPTPTKTDFVFDGWYEDVELTTPVAASFKLTADKTIYAKWTEVSKPTYTLTFNTNGGSSFAHVTAEEGTVIDLSTYNPDKTGFTFGGWYADSALTQSVTSITLSENKTVYAKWTEVSKPTYTLTFNTNGGSSFAHVTAEEGTVIDLSTYNPDKTGFTFGGWYAESALTQSVTSITLNSNTTVYAKWNSTGGGGGGGGGGGSAPAETNTLTFNTNGGSEINSVEAKQGTKISLAEYVTEKSGYVFDGWYSDEELTEKVTEIMLSKDITVYAKWVELIVEKPNYKPGILTDEHYAYIVGREGGMIAPESDITRAEVATIIYRLLDEDERNKAKTKENVFTDVNEGDWFNTAVSTLASLELVKGRTTDTFAPNAFITRAELATIFARMVEIKYDGNVLFSDVSGHWAESYINEAATAEWIVGYNGLFRPDDNITRAEVMTLVNRVLNREPESKDDLLDGMTTWKDNANENIWYYIAVQEATNSHTCKIKADGKHEKWTSLTENPDWSKLEN